MESCRRLKTGVRKSSGKPASSLKTSACAVIWLATSPTLTWPLVTGLSLASWLDKAPRCAQVHRRGQHGHQHGARVPQQIVQPGPAQPGRCVNDQGGGFGRRFQAAVERGGKDFGKS